MTTGRGVGPTDAAGGPARHLPVMLTEVLAHLAPKDAATYVDGTFGAGGYTRAILGAAEKASFADAFGRALAMARRGRRFDNPA